MGRRATTYGKHDRERARMDKAARKQERRELRNRERARAHADSLRAIASGMARCRALGCETMVAVRHAGDDGLCSACRDSQGDG